MNRIFPILGLLALLLAPSALAQPRYDLRFQTSVQDDVLAVTVQIRTNQEVSPLGLANFPFLFDASALSLPAEPVHLEDYEFLAFHHSVDPEHYDTSSVRVSGNIISVNIIPDGVFGTAGTGDIGTSYRDVVRIYFNIEDADASAGLTWDRNEAFASTAVTSEPWSLGVTEDALDVALPVELASFAAQANGGAVLVNWATASETNNAGFDVQYALQDADGFASAGFVEGRGTTSEAQQYAFQFQPQKLGTYRVRLKQVDFDGAFTYSPVVEVEVSQLVSAENGQPVPYTLSQATPNPFHQSSTVTLQVALGQQVEAVLYNALGQSVRTLLDAFLPDGSTRHLTIDGADLSPGLYILHVNGERFAETRQLVLIR